MRNDIRKIEKIVRIVLLIAVIGYVIFLLWYTVFSRDYNVERKRFEGELFWSIRAAIDNPHGMMTKEIIYNCLMLVPVGFAIPWVVSSSIFNNEFEDVKTVGSRDSKNRREIDGVRLFVITAATGFLITCTIETLQLVLRRGLFEFDDIIYNTFGTIVGYLLYLLVRNICVKWILPNCKSRDIS